ncbi:hypothetical protein MPL3356_40605 [Mesorhizobium plurifarium]|uniref:Uncharacterized protein n=1 Tax=Mesorhizobium plurifarium TaxID=69974 RepID=A0A090E3A8_MESPL|nr:hypothetical protein MPL3356_40605 [Mesorhizobium plurifarium]CDX42629.1 hypothetical protein MPLDJ20_50131 [Mesorhizobium plurifarium]
MKLRRLIIAISGQVAPRRARMLATRLAYGPKMTTFGAKPNPLLDRPLAITTYVDRRAVAAESGWPEGQCRSALCALPSREGNNNAFRRLMKR